MAEHDKQLTPTSPPAAEPSPRPRRRRVLNVDASVDVPEPALDWMSRTLEWGVRVKPDENGLTLDSLNVGIYGEVPDQWEEQTRMPRGSYPMPGIPPIGYSLRQKRELWADNAADLYEEAIQRRWAAATDIPWETLKPLPDDVEAAMCQLCTELSQSANVEFETLGGWLHQMSPGYHEIKLFLASNMFDAARHHEAFRKRALSNGGGLGVESRGDVNRMILESKGGWSETSLVLHLLRGLFTLTIYRYGERFAHNRAEQVLFGRAMQDKARHVAYGLQHLRYAVTHQADKAIVFERLLDVGEQVFARELRVPALLEPLAVIFGGGIEGARAGMRQVHHMMGDYVRRYLASTDWIGVNRAEALPADLAQYLEA